MADKDMQDKATNVAEFLNWVHSSFYVKTPTDDGKTVSFQQDHVYYRGQADKSWDLVAGIFRGEAIYEHEFLRQAELQLWDELTTCKSYLEKLVFFQHYGLKTRLLDVTFNPLVALYMACNGEEEIDGKIYCGNKNEDRAEIAELTAEYIFKNDVPNFAEEMNPYFKAHPELKAEYFTKPIFIHAPINNPRIEAQNGAFILTPLFKRSVSSDKDILIKHNGRLKETDSFEDNVIIIPKDKKKDILHELNILGVDEGSLYKDIPAKLRAIMQKEKDKNSFINKLNVDYTGQ